MGVEGVTPIGPRGPESAPAQAPLPRAGPDLSRRHGAAREVRTEPTPQQNPVLNNPKTSQNAVLAQAGPKRAGTRLSVDAATKRIVAKIVDETNQVIKQIPPEELLKIIAQARKMYAKLFDEMV